MAALLLVVCWAALLRADVLVRRYGPFDGPAWLRAFNVAPALAAPLRPPGFAWAPEPQPYVGGDPINYLRFAREMQGFYQGHVREPVFLSLTRLFLWLTGGRDVSVSLASASASLATVPAAWALGSAAASPLVGLIAAALLAADYDAVGWAPDGWRDDTFTLAVTLVALALLRLRQSPSAGRAALVAAAGAVACLTRLTAVSFLAPALVWLVIDGPRSARRQLALLALAAAVGTAAVVAPYLVNSARVFGDPFVALNSHTIYYRAAEGLPIAAPQSAAAYVGQKVRSHPVAALDTALTGIFVLPVENKARGLAFWAGWLPPLLHLLMAAGLFVWLWSPDGRLLLVVTVMSLVPYALTWNVGGGGEWRFTMHVFPLLLVAAVGSLRAAATLIAGGLPQWSAGRRAAVAAALAGLAAAVAGYRHLPVLVAREAILAGESTSVGAGPRDSPFFRDGWLPPRTAGNVTARISAGPRAILRVPLPAAMAPYRLVFRIDPVSATRPSRITVLLNRHLIGHLTLRLDPARVGTYSVPLPAALVGRRHNDLELVADTALPAAEADPRYAALPPAQPIAFRFWYVRVIPLAPLANRDPF